MSNNCILIVEDEGIVAEDLANKVRQLGYEVAAITATGEEAVELARRQRPILVLMDIRLAGAMDGIAAAKQINREHDLPVVFLTAHSDMGTVERAQQAKAFGYILKPFDDRDLRIQIEMALYKHATEQQLRQRDDLLTRNLQQLEKANMKLKQEMAERRRAEEKLHLALASAEEGDRLLSALMEYVPEGILMTDAELNVTRFSRYGQEMLGNAQTDKVTADGTGPRSIYHADGETPMDFADLPLVRAVRGGEVVKDAEIVRVTDRGGVPLLCTAGPIRDVSSKIIGGIVAWRDISDYKRVEEELKRSNQEYQQFAHAVSHDLHEPLRGIVGLLQLVKDKYGDRLDEQGRHYIERTVKAGHRMQQMINDLLHLSRVGNAASAFVPVNLNHLVQDVLEDLQTIIQEKRAEIVFAGLPELEADVGQMRSLFQNLIVNGLKYNKSSRPHIEIGSSVYGNFYRIFIRDNGFGISPKFHDRIFMVFQRLHKDSEYAGIGMGLALCKKIVERHGGTIWVESQPNEGATFNFSLPRIR